MPNMNKDLLRVLRDEINEAVKAIAARHGVTIHAGDAKFTAEQATFKLEVTCNTVTGQAQTTEELDFKANAWRYGLTQADLGRTLTTPLGVFKLVGMKPKSHTYPFVAKSLRDGRLYKLAAHTVKNAVDTANRAAAERTAVNQ